MKRMYFLLGAFTLAVLLQSLPAFAAEDCPTVRLDQTDPDVSNIPIWNQKTLNACFEYSSTFLATVWIRKHWKKLHSEMENFSIDPKSNYFAMKKSPNLAQILDAENGRTCMSLKWTLRTVADSEGKKIAELSMPSCEMFGLVGDEDHQILLPKEEIRQKMQSLFNGPSPQPYAIEFCAGVLDGKDGLIVNRVFQKTLTYLNSSGRFNNFSPSCTFHVAVVIGQEMHNGSCQFRVRNSWGVDAEGSDNGYFWVKADLLANNTMRVITLEPK